MRFIAGSGRSGTTWVLDAIAKANGLRPVFEPLNPHASEMGFRYAHRALRSEDHHPELRAFLLEVFAGRRERLWTQYRRQRNWIIPGRKELESAASRGRYVRRLGRFLIEGPELALLSMRNDAIVKCIWANLMLGWIAGQLDCRIVLIVRHPGAVIESELRSGWDADSTLDRFRKDPRFNDVTHGRYARFLERPLSNVEALALRWLIENQQHVENECNGAVSIAFYEDLADARKPAWNALCAHLGLINIPDSAVLARPSQQSWSRAAGVAGEASNPSWRDAITAEQSELIQGILDEAEFTRYSMKDAQPATARPDGRSVALGTAQ